MTHCSNKTAHTADRGLREMPYWGLRGQHAILGPIRSSEILVPSPWPETLRIPGKTLPVAGRCHRIKLTRWGPMGIFETDPVPGLSELRPYFPAAGPPKNVKEPKEKTIPPPEVPPQAVNEQVNEEIPKKQNKGKEKKGKGNGKKAKKQK